MFRAKTWKGMRLLNFRVFDLSFDLFLTSGTLNHSSTSWIRSGRWPILKRLWNTFTIFWVWIWGVRSSRWSAFFCKTILCIKLSFIASLSIAWLGLACVFIWHFKNCQINEFDNLNLNYFKQFYKSLKHTRHNSISTILVIFFPTCSYGSFIWFSSTKIC